MKRLLLAVLVVANVASVAVLASLLNTGHADQLQVSDLAYGAVDLDGNGKYEAAEDFVLEWFLRNNPEEIEKALKVARVNKDGGIDLSAYLLSVELPKGAEVPR